MTIKLRGKVFHIDVCKGGQRVRTTGGKTYEEAKRLEAQVRLQLDAGGVIAVSHKPAGKTLGSILDKAMTGYWETKLQGRSLATQKSLVNVLKRQVGNYPVVDINYKVLSDWGSQWIQKGASSSTVRSRVNAIQVALRWAHRNGHIETLEDLKGATLGLPRKRIRRRVFSDLEQQQILGFLATRNGPRSLEFLDLFVCLLDTGCRISELRTLQESQIDLKRRLIFIPTTKNNEPKTVAMTTQVHSILSKRKGFHLSYQACKRVWKSVRKHLGMTSDVDFVLHTCRHTTGTKLVDLGIDIHTVQRYLGHQSVSTTTKFYSHASTRTLKAAAKKLSRVP